MAEMKTLNGYEIVDNQARETLKKLNADAILELAEDAEVLRANIDSAISDIDSLETRTTTLEESVENITTNYAKTKDIPTKVSQLDNDNNYLNSIPEEYITETELSDKGYLTEHQSLAGYATEEYVDNKVIDVEAQIPQNVSELENDAGYLTEHQSLDGYATETYVNETAAKHTAFLDLSACTTTEEWTIVGDDVAQFAEAYLANRNICVYVRDIAGSNYWLADTYLFGDENIPQISLPRASINLRDVANSIETKAKYIQLARISGVWKYKVTSDDSFTFASQNYVDEAIANSESSYWLDFSGATTEAQAATDYMLKFADYIWVDTNWGTNIEIDRICVYVRDTHSTAYIPASMSVTVASNTVNIRLSPASVNPASLYDVRWDNILLTYIPGNNTGTYKIESTGQFQFATKTDVYNMVADLEERIAALEGNQ